MASGNKQTIVGECYRPAVRYYRRPFHCKRFEAQTLHSVVQAFWGSTEALNTGV